MLLSIKSLGKFVKDYACYHHIKPLFKCKIVFYSGSMREVELSWLESLELNIKYIKGDNKNNYKRLNQELVCNTIIYQIAKQNKLLRRTSLSKDGYSCIHIVFQKDITPFDNCIDLKLIVYENFDVIRHSSEIMNDEDIRMFSQSSSIFDDLYKAELETLLYEIHKKGYILNKIVMGQRTNRERYVIIADFSYMTKNKKMRLQYEERKKLLKLLTDHQDCSCFCM